MLSHTAGFLLLIWLAHLISRNGVGNGVCWITLSELLDAVPSALLDLWMKSRMSHLGEETLMRIVFFIIPLAVISFLAVLALIGAQWQMPLKCFESADVTPSAFRLRINGVGIVGLNMAQSVLFIPSTLAVILPSGFPGQLLFQRMSEFGFTYWLTWGILVFVATYFWTAWAYRPSGLQAILNKFHNTSGAAGSSLVKNNFERRLAIITLPLALGLPFIGGGLVWLAQKSSFHALAPLVLFPVAAISLDLFRQFKIHRRMAAAFIGDKKESICAECHANTNDEDQFCPSCGIAFEENLYCDTHPEATASAHCVICQKKLCEDCGMFTQGRYVCEEHDGVEMIEGWATALVTTTRLDAELLQQDLEKLGIPALTLSNTIEPAYGTLGLFEINPVTPFVVYRELGGGRIRLMVPAYDLMQAQEYLAKMEVR